MPCLGGWQRVHAGIAWRNQQWRRTVRLVGCHSWGSPTPQTLKSQLLLLLAIAASIPSASQLSAAAAPATEFRATVLSIGDGDTLRLLQGQRRIIVRLACIDAPAKAQASYGQVSRQLLASLAPLGSSLQLRLQGMDCSAAVSLNCCRVTTVASPQAPVATSW